MSFQATSIIKKKIRKSPFFNNSVESMADWSPSSDSHQDSNPDCLGFGKSERLWFRSANCQWAVDCLKIYLKIQDMHTIYR